MYFKIIRKVGMPLKNKKGKSNLNYSPRRKTYYNFKITLQQYKHFPSWLFLAKIGNLYIFLLNIYIYKTKKDIVFDINYT